MARDLFCDNALARRLERSEAFANARAVETRAALFPESGATWIEVGGAYAMFDGKDSPISQSFGLGLFAEPEEQHLAEIEAFFGERDTPVFHEVSPLAHPSILGLLATRGYQPVELSTVLYMPLPEGSPFASPNMTNGIAIRIVDQSESDLWVRTGAEGWRELAEYAGQIKDLLRLGANRGDVPLFLAELDGRPIATGALSVHGGIALLAGASTIPEARNRGAQGALLQARLQFAAEAGCDLAMMCAEPGGASQRNAQRKGFCVAYTRMKWRLQDGRS